MPIGLTALPANPIQRNPHLPAHALVSRVGCRHSDSCVSDGCVGWDKNRAGCVCRQEDGGNEVSDEFLLFLTELQVRDHHRERESELQQMRKRDHYFFSFINLTGLHKEVKRRIRSDLIVLSRSLGTVHTSNRVLKGCFPHADTMWFFFRLCYLFEVPKHWFGNTLD